MKSRLKKNILQAVLLLALTAFAIWFALKDDYQEVLRNIKQVSIRWLLLILVLGVIYYVLQGYVLYLVARKYKKDIRIRDGLHNAFIAAFFNGVTPLGGGQVSQTYAFRKIGISYTNIASILWIDFFLYQSVVVVYVLTFLILKFAYALQTFHTYFFLVIIGFVVNSFVILALWTMSKFPTFYIKVSHLALGLLYKIKIVKDKEAALRSWQAQITYFNQEIKGLKNDVPLIVKGVLINCIRITIFYSLPFFVALGLGIDMKAGDLLNVMLMSSFIHMLNALTPLPGDTGWTESVFIIIFATMFGRVNASSVMIIWRMSTYHLNLLIGGSTFLYVRAKKRVPDTRAILEAEEGTSKL